MQGRIVIVVLVLIVAFVWVSMYGGADHFSASSASSHAPDFGWQAFDGSRHTLKELKGRAVVLHFWASWCGPCREEFPKLLNAAAANKDIVFLTVSGDEDKQKAGQFIRQMQVVSKTKNLSNMLYAFDPQKAIIFDVFQTVQYPESILLDTGHHMKRKFPGPVDWGSEDIQNGLSQLK